MGTWDVPRTSRRYALSKDVQRNVVQMEFAWTENAFVAQTSVDKVAANYQLKDSDQK